MIDKIFNKENWHILSSTVKTGAERSIGVINGILGHHLADISSPMNFFDDKKEIDISKDALSRRNPSPKVVILIHGLICDETYWKLSDSEDYGTLLEKEMGLTPFHLRYNTGLHISTNGKEFSHLLEKLLNNYPIPIESITIIAHSMGGLVTRSACFYAGEFQHKWVEKVKTVFFLGSPHDGAPLEKFGNILAHTLTKLPLPYTGLAGHIINLRSDGIKDLRFGYLRDEDWVGKDQDALLEKSKYPVPLLDHIDYFVITGKILANSDSLLSEWLGDIMVPKPSALGKAKEEEHHLNFKEENHREFPGLDHLSLMHNLDVYKEIKAHLNRE